MFDERGVAVDILILKRYTSCYANIKHAVDKQISVFAQNL